MPISDSSLPVKDLSGLLRQTLGDNFTIEKIDWKNLTNPGENFGSLILAVNATVKISSKTETLHLVVKLPPPSAWLQDLFNSPWCFEKELQFYRDLTPAFLSLQRENGAIKPEESWLGAQYYGGRLGIENPEIFDEQASIVLQNLNFSGYKTVDRHAGLNKTQCEFAVKKLAQLHAIVIGMREKKPKMFEELVLPTLQQSVNETTKNCVMDMQRNALADLRKIPEAASYLESAEKTVTKDRDAAGTEVPKDRWATLVHNDFWVNNMMFKFGEAGKVLDMKIVDFQLGVYDYGVNDLIFFLVSSPTSEVVDESFDELVSLYYEAFSDALDTLKVDTAAFPKSELLAKLDECGPTKFSQCLMMIQVIKSEPSAVPKMEDIQCSESFLSIAGGEKYKQKMLHTVRFFAKRGWLIK